MKDIAKQQITLLMRSHWLTAFGFLFSTLAIIVVLIGSAGDSGYMGFNRMSASLLNLNLLLIPLLSLLVGSLFLSGEREDQGFMLLMTYPVNPWKIVIGKYIGIFISIGAVLTFGYGTALIAIFFMGKVHTFLVLFIFYVYSVLLSAMFLSISILIGLYAKSRFQALGTSLIVWAFAVLFYEFIVMGISIFVANQWQLYTLSASVFLNPVELIRVQSILSLDGATVFGPRLYDLTIWAQGSTGQSIFVASILFWITWPMVLSVKRLKGGE